MLKTFFDPARHGFHFSNSDIKWTFAGIEGQALCGGMVYASLDYYKAQRTIPPTKTAPVEGTALHDYIYARQTTAHLNTGARFVGSWMPIIGPFVAQGAAGADGEYDRLIRILRGGSPVPLCTVGAGKGHHVLAIGCSGTRPIEISIYDPNVPNRVGTITKHPSGYFKNSFSPSLWHTFFLDEGYSFQQPTYVHFQDRWRWCRRCQSLVFGGATTGVCASGGGHDTFRSPNYVIDHQVGQGQSGWLWCFKCEGLYYGGNPGSPGICPDGGLHNGLRSGKYFLTTGSGDGESNWRHCRNCESLFHAGQGRGVCPADPKGHDAAGSGNYFIPFYRD